MSAFLRVYVCALSTLLFATKLVNVLHDDDDMASAAAAAAITPPPHQEETVIDEGYILSQLLSSALPPTQLVEAPPPPPPPQRRQTPTTPKKATSIAVVAPTLTVPTKIRCNTGKANTYVDGRLLWVWDTDDARQPHKNECSPAVGALVEVYNGSATSAPKIFNSLSTAANAIRNQQSNGFKTWEARASDGTWIKIDQFRKRRHGGGFVVSQESDALWQRWRMELCTLPPVAQSSCLSSDAHVRAQHDFDPM